MVDAGVSVDGSICFIVVGCCLSTFIAFRFRSASHLLDEERVFRYVGGACPKTSKSGSIPER